MSSALYIAWRYLAYNRVKTAILVVSIALIAYVPVGLRVLVDRGARELTARAEATPLLVGARGSPLELVLNSLYFESEPPATMAWSEVSRIADSGLARAVPLSVRFRARGFPIVGTTLDYFDLRGLRIDRGRMLARLGECVVGAAVAEMLGLAPGDGLVSSPETVFDLAGVYPLRMRVAGVLAPAGGPDDRAVFVDVKTVWVIEGLGHGHRDLAAPDASGAVLSRDERKIVANASLVEYTEIDATNVDSFHFHGDMAAYPLTAVIVAPHDDKSAALLQGRYQSSDEAAQIARPSVVMSELLTTVLTVRGYVVAAFLVVGAATASTAALVFLLSLRLRRREIETMRKIGGSRRQIAAILAAEVLLVIVSASALAALLTVATSRFGDLAIRAFVRM